MWNLDNNIIDTQHYSRMSHTKLHLQRDMLTVDDNYDNVIVHVT